MPKRKQMQTLKVKKYLILDMEVQLIQMTKSIHHRIHKINHWIYPLIKNLMICWKRVSPINSQLVVLHPNYSFTFDFLFFFMLTPLLDLIKCEIVNVKYESPSDMISSFDQFPTSGRNKNTTFENCTDISIKDELTIEEAKLQD